MAMNHIMIAGKYFQNEGASGLSMYYLYNKSLTTEITLGSIYILKPEGLEGDTTVWNGLANEIIPPLGNVGFNMSQTGVLQENHSFTVVIMWEGPADALRLEGVVQTMDPDTNDLLGYFTLEPF